jgi:hypothetical protein
LHQDADLEGRLLWMNEGGMQALEICDFSPFANSSWFQFWEGEEAKAARDAVETARKGGRPLHGVFRLGDYEAAQVVGRRGRPDSRLGRRAERLLLFHAMSRNTSKAKKRYGIARS